MTHNLIAWTAFFVALVGFVAAVVLFWRNNSRSKSRDERQIEFLRGGPGVPYLLRENTVSCEGCGCLLHKVKGFQQAATIAKVEWHCFDGSSKWVNTIVEHYLCLRCQVDGTPPAKIAEAIDEAQKAAKVSPC